MKKMLLVILCTLLGVQSMNAQPEAYAELTSGDKTLTFYYDDKKSSREGFVFRIDDHGWTEAGVKTHVERVVFDDSFADCRPTSTECWFKGLYNMKEIIGLANLNTSEVVKMNGMFQETHIRSLDLSTFDTSNVWNMSFMFFGNHQLTSLNLSSFNTSKVQKMDWMFYGCVSLRQLDLSNFNTAETYDMDGMFSHSGLDSLDLSSFKTHWLILYTRWMFKGCKDLKKIYVSSNWHTSSIKESEEMFLGCENLEGCAGTVYDENHVDGSYAHIDEGPSSPGYFSKEHRPYAVLESDGTLMFYYDSEYDNRPGTAYFANVANEKPEWNTDDVCQHVTKVVFDASFASARPTSTYFWFDAMSNLQTIEGLEYLNTSEVKTMRAMFNDCSSLQSLDLSRFDTSSATDMGYMFNGCYSLKTVKLSNFSTEAVTDMGYMFNGCLLLPSLDLVTFNTEQLINTSGMFAHCRSLASIVVSDGWNIDDVAYSEMMFLNCVSIVGYEGTVYDESHTDGSYARVDGGASAPGYLTYNVPREYALIVGGVRVTTLNRNNIPVGEGSAVYDPINKALYLTDCNLTGLAVANSDAANGYGAGLYSNISRLTVYVSGNVTVSRSPNYPENIAVFFNDRTDLVGIGGAATFTATGYNGIFSDTLTIRALPDCHLTVVAEGSEGGLVARRDRKSRPQLTYIYNRPLNMPYANITLKCKGSTLSGISYWQEMGGDPRLQFTAPNPKHMQWNPIQHMVCDTYGDGNPILDEWIVMEAPHEAYAVYHEGTLTFYCDGSRSGHTDPVYDLNEDKNMPGWWDDGNYKDVTSVVFDESFADARPTSTYYWFSFMKSLTSVSGLKYLNTSEVTNMSNMFYQCENLASLDLRYFNTGQVRKFDYMFSQCELLDGIDVSGFVTTSAVSMEGMFYACHSLKALDLIGFTTRDVTNMQSLFAGCKLLTSLDLGSFNTANVKNMASIFYNCEALETVKVGAGWSTAKVSSSDDMFYNCTSLVGGAGTAYDAEHLDAEYAHIDGGAANPGYLTAAEGLMQGDVNDDGKADIADVVALSNAIQAGSTDLKYDINDDGEVNAQDITALVNIIAGK